MITLGKRGDLHAKVQAASFLRVKTSTLFFFGFVFRFDRKKTRRLKSNRSSSVLLINISVLWEHPLGT